MKPASTMSPANEQNALLQYLQHGYARARADEAYAQEGFVRLR